MKRITLRALTLSLLGGAGTAQATHPGSTGDRAAFRLVGQPHIYACPDLHGGLQADRRVPRPSCPPKDDRR
ncbi:MAG: hypothetical protein M3Q92_11135 [Actinomycetota bacterium]|nr:hypothetical protein [Actinomycetota bacterium]